MAELNLAEKKELLASKLAEAQGIASKREERWAAEKEHVKNVLTVCQEELVKEPLRRTYHPRASKLAKLLAIILGRQEFICPECDLTLHKQYYYISGEHVNFYWCDCCYQYAY